MWQETSDVDRLEASIIRCLQVYPRVQFRLVAELLDVSEQTVARRYRRLVDTGILRVTAVVNPSALGQSNWIIRTKCRPSGADSLAQALAQRDDVGWVTVQSGGAEVFAVLRARTSESRDHLLIQRLPRSAPVLDISPFMVLHRFVGSGAIDDWTGFDDLLDAGVEQALRERAQAEYPRLDRQVSPAVLSHEDLALLDELTRDGRSTFAALARAAGIDEGRATRRLRALVGSGVAYLDVDVSTQALGFSISAALWLTVAPSSVDAVGRALVAQRPVAFAAAVSGPQNVTATVVCRDTDHLYAFVTDGVGAIPGVQGLEISPTLRTVKQAGAMMAGDRLVPAR